MHPQPHFSVVIPAYNHARYVENAIESVRAQAWSDHEILLIDDGSTDETPQLVAGRFPSIRYIRQENQGLSAARNTGIRASHGRIIALLDADDAYEPEFMSTVAEMLGRNPRAAAAYCGYHTMDGDGHPLPYGSSRVVAPRLLHETLLYGNFLVPSCMAAYRSCYEAVGSFDESLRACEDWDMWLRISDRFKVVGTDRRLVRYRIVDQSMSSDPTHMLRYREAVLDKHFVNGREKSNPMRNRAYAEAYLRAAVENLQTDDVTGAFRCVERVARLHPALLAGERAFYELACGIQPRGFSGNFESLDVARSRRVLQLLLERLDADGSQLLGGFRSRAYSSAQFALAKLSYGARDPRAARIHLRRALREDFRILGSLRFWNLLARSAWGKRFSRPSRRSIPAAH